MMQWTYCLGEGENNPCTSFMGKCLCTHVIGIPNTTCTFVMSDAVEYSKILSKINYTLSYA